MDDSNAIYIISLIVLVGLSAFFSATETAYSSVNRIRLKNYSSSGNKRAMRALKISNNFDNALSAILIGNNIVNIAAASIGTAFFVKHMGSSGVTISTIVMTIVVLIFGEVTPKSIAKQHPEKFALAVSGILNVMIIIFKPLIFVLTSIKKLIPSKLVAGDASPSVTEEELKFIIEEIEDEGVLEEHESELVQSALDFDDITVSEVLTPRVDVVAIEIGEDSEKIKDIVLNEGFSRMPVYEKTIDNIVGVLNEKDFMRAYLKDKNVDIKPLLQEAVFVPPKKHIAELLKEIQKQKMHLAVVTDQYGGTLGIITLEDILEELVGDIWDEGDEVTSEVTVLSNDTYRVSAEMNVYDMFEMLDMGDNEFDGQSQSVGGWALECFEKIPDKYDSFDYKNLHIVVEAISEQRIESLLVKVNR